MKQLLKANSTNINSETQMVCKTTKEHKYLGTRLMEEFLKLNSVR